MAGASGSSWLTTMSSFSPITMTSSAAINTSGTRSRASSRYSRISSFEAPSKMDRFGEICCCCCCGCCGCCDCSSAAFAGPLPGAQVVGKLRLELLGPIDEPAGLEPSVASMGLIDFGFVAGWPPTCSPCPIRSPSTSSP